jgi:hypothetical protein
MSHNGGWGMGARQVQGLFLFFANPFGLGWYYHLRNHLGAIFITFRNYLSGISRNHLQPSYSVSRLSFVSQGYEIQLYPGKEVFAPKVPSTHASS